MWIDAITQSNGLGTHQNLEQTWGKSLLTWFFQTNFTKIAWSLVNLWVCLKMLGTPKPNGFADHYPNKTWLFHWEYTLVSDKPIWCGLWGSPMFAKPSWPSSESPDCWKRSHFVCQHRLFLNGWEESLLKFIYNLKVISYTHIYIYVHMYLSVCVFHWKLIVFELPA